MEAECCKNEKGLPTARIVSCRNMKLIILFSKSQFLQQLINFCNSQNSEDVTFGLPFARLVM